MKLGSSILTFPDAPIKNEIRSFIHCKYCTDDIPEGESPKDYQRVEVGFTENGIQVWCNRHNANVVHVDLGNKEQ